MGVLRHEMVGGKAIMGKTAVVFPGQGSQYVGMGKCFYEASEASRQIFEKASIALGEDVAALCFESDEETLRLTQNTQPTILTVSMAIYEALKEKGLEADGFAGLSLGEFSALVAGGALKFEDAVKVVRARGRLMQEEVPVGKGAMAAILGAEREVVEAVCMTLSAKGIVSVANYNCPQQIVIAGEVAVVNEAVALLKEQGAKKAVLLPVSAPFHTKMLLGAGEKLGDVLAGCDILTPVKTVFTNVTANAYEPQTDIRQNLMNQVSASVRWEDEIINMIQNGYDTFIEVGPGTALTKFIKKIDKSVKLINIEKYEDLASLDILEKGECTA